MNGNICKEYAAAMNYVWKDTYLQSFAIILLHEQDNAEQWRKKLQNAKYYHSMVSENALLICNIRYEDAEKAAKQSVPRSFLYADCSQGKISIRSMKWGILVKNKGLLRRGFTSAGSYEGSSVYDTESHTHLTTFLAEYGLSLASVQSETAQIIEKIKQKQQLLGCDNDSMMTFLRKSLDDTYYAKGRFFSRATIYHA